MSENWIDRLRHSKGRFEESQREEGRKDGEAWARQHAEYEDLLRLSVAFAESAPDSAAAVAEAIGGDCAVIFGNSGDELSSSFVSGFINGAIEVMMAID